jgi:hypothetical protein
VTRRQPWDEGRKISATSELMRILMSGGIATGIGGVWMGTEPGECFEDRTNPTEALPAREPTEVGRGGTR